MALLHLFHPWATFIVTTGMNVQFAHKIIHPNWFYVSVAKTRYCRPSSIMQECFSIQDIQQLQLPKSFTMKLLASTSPAKNDVEGFSCRIRGSCQFTIQQYVKNHGFVRLLCNCSSSWLLLPPHLQLVKFRCLSFLPSQLNHLYF